MSLCRNRKGGLASLFAESETLGTPVWPASLAFELELFSRGLRSSIVRATMRSISEVFK